jgi:hypothetical protein
MYFFTQIFYKFLNNRNTREAKYGGYKSVIAKRSVL